MQFNVPQFIEIEDKILGPLSFKQAVYLAGGAGAIFVIHRLLGWWLGIWLMIPIAALALALAFFKVNNRPFVIILEASIKYWLGRKLYVWRKEEKKPVAKSIELSGGKSQPLTIPKLSASRLKELSWSLDVNQNVK